MIDEPWVKNLQKALLLDPLVVLHGNVRDKFYIQHEKQSRMPKHLGETRYADFPIWLAIELEAKGYDLIIFYDSVDEAIVLRPEMVSLFERVAMGAKSEKPVLESTKAGDSEAKSTKASSLLPKVSTPSTTKVANSPPWMVKIQQGLNPQNFVRILHDRIFQNTEISTVVIFRYTDRYLSFSDRQDTDEKRLSVLLQKTAMSLSTNLNPSDLQSRLLLLFDLEGAAPQELGSQAPFAGSARIPTPSIQSREHFSIVIAIAFTANQDSDSIQARIRFN